MKYLSILFILTCKFATAQFVQHITADRIIGVPPIHFLIADEVSLRAQPSSTGQFLKALKVGTPLTVLKTHENDTLTIKGIRSSWYKIRTKNNDSGWVWGGFIAQHVFGSNEYPTVKILLGYDHFVYEERQHAGGTKFKIWTMYVQLKALRNGEVISEITHPVTDADKYLRAEHFGKKGVKGIHDIIKVWEPCVGGCGCQGGNVYFFWDGNNIQHAVSVFGTADAEYSEGTSVLFPSDIGGDPDFIKLIDDRVDYTYEKKGEMRRIITTTFHTWNGVAVVPSISRQPEQRIVMNNNYLE